MWDYIFLEECERGGGGGSLHFQWGGVGILRESSALTSILSSLHTHTHTLQRAVEEAEPLDAC